MDDGKRKNSRVLVLIVVLQLLILSYFVLPSFMPRLESFSGFELNKGESGAVVVDNEGNIIETPEYGTGIDTTETVSAMSTWYEPFVELFDRLFGGSDS